LDIEHSEIVIVGAGACGLMCAVQAGLLGKKVLVLEKNARGGAKILISGGGRCNYTNLHCTVENFVSENAQFARSSFAQWTVDDTIVFFEGYGIVPQEKVHGQLFPQNNKASDLLEGFERSCRHLGQELRCNAEVIALERSPGVEFSLTYLHHGVTRVIQCSKVVLASGGLPIRKIGATDFALRTARSLSMDVCAVAPALVPLVITSKNASWYESLSGNTVFSRVSIGKVSFEDNILFTHWGLSGPAILQISSYWRPGQSIFIDLYPQGDFLELLQSERMANGKRQLGTLLAGLYTRRFADSLQTILPVSTTLASLTGEELRRIALWFQRFEFKPAGDKGYEKAEVMRGGVSTAGLNSKTLESKTVPGLYFGGECVDITGWLGGFNFQWAWASGFVIAQNL